ncbi:Septum site-determining protein MinD [Roseivivax jejudonensis]|uniref:Septum site-determining protein MinD n=1 Tax=Roseivivax jejudonensis TaxID=1529041 RepID=A0A1X7A7V1_9RHOB|nr:pilus assembly protein CpaE [Roseivivax jejudonensis]SLN72410.1 Septum site-determining protein MinD [Roseivivax jejudonensis]
MTLATAQTAEIGPVRACTVSRDVQLFDLLIEDMEQLLGESWGDLGFSEAMTFLGQPDAASLEFIALAIDDTDEENIDRLDHLIAAAKARGVKVVLIAEDVTPAALHRLLKNGADEFVPYPLPEGELAAAVERLNRPEPSVLAAPQEGEKVQLTEGGDGVVIAAHGLSGGVGTTTFAVNLAWELATVVKDKDRAPRVCLIDFGLQFGSVATYLDLPRKEPVLEILSDIDSLDAESFAQALVNFDDRLQVFTAPPDLLPLDMIGPAEVQKLIDIACNHFDFVVIDLPSAVLQWSETVLNAAQVFFALVELDMRSAQNTLRLKRALQSEDLPFEKLRFVLNRAPKFTDLQGKSRAKRMAESLGIALDLHLPDGGRVVGQACDHGLPLASQAAKNPLRREIAKLAQSLYAVGQSDADADAA